MSTVLLLVSMSLDGYVAGPNVAADEPMGEGGERLHEWMFADPSPTDVELMARTRAATGAVVIGRRTFDVGLRHWGDVPYPAPSFVVTHEQRPELAQESGTFTFVDGVPSAIDQARAAAGDRTVVLMGADLARQALRAGLVDEVFINLVPVTLGGGASLFAGLDVHLAPAEVISSPAVTHLRYRVVR
ncbi:MAG: dihydrofolate reductase [Actinophytocola sp.]|uniref:dihydrofolate reductase family protein n=1 Tax=Actinophytocola sp. TaxID=1872138 RepID=UPI00132C5C40|nr:dihydrofolate reductase family protein [Actinophytocola sp.]MPZ80275.1 dihydrofolate reductase [Actinophytocola sp.]